MLFSNGKHSTRTTGRVIKGFDNACLGQGLIVGIEQNIHHKFDYFPGGKVLSRCFVGLLRKTPDQILKHITHLHGVHVGQINLGKLLDHLKKNIRLRVIHTFNLVIKIEIFDDLPGGS